MANQVDLNHKYFISLAVKNEIAWSALKFIIEGLTPTLEKSKEVNNYLLEELEKFNVRFQSLELERVQSGNNDKGTKSETCLIKTPEQSDTLENTETIEHDIEVLEIVKDSMNEENSGLCPEHNEHNQHNDL